jgi:hypothetical protein
MRHHGFMFSAWRENDERFRLTFDNCGGDANTPPPADGEDLRPFSVSTAPVSYTHTKARHSGGSAEHRHPPHPLVPGGMMADDSSAITLRSGRRVR